MEQLTQEELAERRFAKRAVFVTTAIMLILTAIGVAIYQTRGEWIPAKAAKYAEAGNYARAIALIEKMEESQKREELIFSMRYEEATALLESGDASAAKEIFSTLGTYSDSQMQVLECRYREAKTVQDAGRYEEAASLYFALSGYSDSMQQYDKCRYEQAVALCNSGDVNGALSLFIDLGSYGDAATRAETLAVGITGIADPEHALQAAMGYSPEALKAMERLAAIRELRPAQAIAVGFFHTVGLQADGTVVAAGRNEEGQCDVSAWTDIVALDAGAYHTVGLKKDGTVVAVGRGSEGQCDVFAWQNVIAVTCTDYNTAALLSDGTVVTTGYQKYPSVSGWQDVIAIGGGSYVLSAVRSSGQLFASHLSSQDDTFSRLIAADVSTGYAVGLRGDGTVQHTAADLSDWQDVIAISAATTATYGLTANGTIKAHTFMERDTIDLSGIENAVAIAADATHVAILRSDGTVVVRGENDYGECNTADWKLGEWDMENESAQKERIE